MTTAPAIRPRLFIIGLPRVLRLDLTDAFCAEGYAVSPYTDLRLAAAAVDRCAPEAILLDWMPGSLAQVERYGGLVPILMLTAHGPLLDVVRCLRAGAADYMRLPCHFPEVLARVERARATTTTHRRVSLGPVCLDVAGGEACIDGERVALTEREARMLAALMRCPGHPVAREALMRVAGITTAQATIVESYIKKLRKRHALLRHCLRTRYGRGYAYCP